MVNFVPLDKLLGCERSASLKLVFADTDKGSVNKTWQHWRQRVAMWQALLAAQPGQRWALYHDDAFEFSAALFGLWAAGKIACVPGSTQPVFVEKLASRVDGFIGEFATQQVMTLTDDLALDAEWPATVVDLNDQQLVMEVFTSGSSGEPQAIPKYLFQLRNEINNLQTLWADAGKNALVLATVSHHHIYGLLFRVLWPLAAGERFATQLCEYFEDVQRIARAQGKIILISSPTHLSRIPDATKWNVIREHCSAIFSSGAPLPQAASVSATKLLGRTPIEVYGSSETGGIAIRQQEEEREVPWQTVPGLRIALDEATQCLKIHSPYLVHNDADDWYVTSDKIEIVAAETFFLRGRSDNIVKIEGKRVSISEMERRLLSHPWIEASKLVQLQGARTELGAVLVLNTVGEQNFHSLGKRTLNKTFQDYLLAQFERPVLPRRWRFVRELPFDKQGKITQFSLAELFGTDTSGEQ